VEISRGQYAHFCEAFVPYRLFVWTRLLVGTLSVVRRRICRPQLAMCDLCATAVAARNLYGAGSRSCFLIIEGLARSP
jgi:hypothetical protein